MRPDDRSDDHAHALSVRPVPRLPEVDALKSFGILAVILIHTLRDNWDPYAPPIEVTVKSMLHFAVPAFFVASGYLYSTMRPATVATLSRRLTRIIAPYLIATCVAQAYWRALGEGARSGAVWKDFLLSASLGPYYFVFVLIIFVLLIPLFSRMHPRVFPVLVPLLLIVQYLFVAHLMPPLLYLMGLRDSPSFDLFWYARNPFLYLGYFALGWWARQQRETIVRWLRPRRGFVSTILALAFVDVAAVLYLDKTSAFDLSRPELAVFLSLGVLAALAFLYAATVDGKPLPAPLRLLSDATYPIYLYHLFPLMTGQSLLARAPRAFEPDKVLLLWVAALLTSLLLVALGRALLGRRSRLLLGA